MRILLVEDDPTQLSLVIAHLELSGYRVTGTACADHALSILRPAAFEAVVTDYHLGRRNGAEIVRGATRLGIPSILITGAANRAEVARSVNLGARYVIVKPFSAGELIERIEDIVGDNSSRSHLEKFMRRFRRGGPS